MNEHVGYDIAAMQKLTRRLVAALSQADPADRPTFVSNAATFARGLAGLEHREALIRAAHAGTSVAITAPVPLYLLEACGLVNTTPDAFSAAIR